MTCPKCNYDHVDIHRSTKSVLTYCQQCGETTEEKVDPSKQEKALPLRRPMMLNKPQGNSAISKLIPIPDKKKKKY